jgi:hypothetical protein
MPKPIRLEVGTAAHESVSRTDDLSEQRTVSSQVSESEQGAVPPEVSRQARELAEHIDALSAQHAVPPELHELALRLASELGAEKPAENPEGLPGTLTDQVRPVRETVRDLVRRLTAEAESSRPLRKRLAGAIETAEQLDRGLTRLVDGLPRPGRQTPSPGGPAETFALEGPAGDRLVAWVTPQLVPATVEVAAPSHSQVHVPVLARFFPAHTVHARKSAAVVAGDHCQLQSVDHYHVHRLSLSLDELLKPGSRGHAALQKLLKDRSDSGFEEFQRSMRAIADSPGQRETQASVPVQDDPRTLVTSSENVQLGDGSRTNMTTHYLVDEAELHIVELLARDRNLARSLVAAVDETEPGAASRKFLRDAARSAGRTDDLTLLDHCTGLRQSDTSIYWLFGVDAVSGASAVMIGRDNELHTDMRVHRGDLRRSIILADLGEVRRQAARAREGPAADPRRSGLTRPAAPGVLRAALTGRDLPEGGAPVRPPPGGGVERDIGRGIRPRDTGPGDTGRGGLGRG